MALAIWGSIRAVDIAGREQLSRRPNAAGTQLAGPAAPARRTSRKPVTQKIVRKSDGKEVLDAQQRKAHVSDRDHAVILTSKECESVEPASSRDIALEHFVPPNVIGDQWYAGPTI